ncbi:unnamed protein product [Pieris macdunnoughi]|uniref:Uncharacterized protein n=1 Tax=Pieris macdunnoughi TaxID=345717 RepID=A0A821XS43_9NEOP|nr:unnamed protein product [Pieris macdunnoughi]
MKFMDNKRELNTEDSILPNEEPNQNETTGNEGAVVSHPTGYEEAVVTEPNGIQGILEPQPSTFDDSNIYQNSQSL